MTVESQDASGSGIDTVTISSVQAGQTFTPSALAANLPDGAIDAGSAESLEIGEAVHVVQLGSSDMSRTPAPLLERGAEYLLFLVPAEPHYDGYWIVGGDAGMFRPDGSGGFAQVIDTEDTFPHQISEADLQ